MALSKQALFDAIRLARPLLILLVCIAHIPGIEGFRSEVVQFDQLDTLLTTFLRDVLARGAVPILTVISGYLAYASFCKRSYSQFIADKVMRLLVPFLLWNAIALLIAWVFFSLWQIDYGNMASRDSAWAFARSLLGIYQLPINPPTYFLRDLFTIMLVVPVIHVCCKKWWRLLPVMMLYVALFWHQPGVTIHVHEWVIPLMFRADMVLFFVFGYALAQHRIAVPRVGAYSICTCFILILVFGGLVSMMLAAFSPSPRAFLQWRTVIGALFVCIAPAVLVGLLSIKNTLVGRFLAFFSPYSFTLFLSHILTANGFYFVLRKGFNLSVNDGSPWYVLMAYLVAYLVCVSSVAIVILTLWRRVLANAQRIHGTCQRLNRH